MANESNIHMGKAPFFDGTNYDYWKIRMVAYLKVIDRRMWKIVNEGYVIIDERKMTKQDEENELINDQAVNVLYSALDINEFNRVKGIESAHGIWERLMEIHEGTTIVKEHKVFAFKSFHQSFPNAMCGLNAFHSIKFIDVKGTIE